ncbi:MAG: glpT [Parachlamydiales bacterium]|nr:glpT [Parachlamydiales bacterium]
MRLLDFLKPAPYVEEIQDESLVKKNYRYWRLRTFGAMYIGYAFYYFTRKSFTFAMPAMQDSLGMDKFQLGLIASILSITYGLSKFLSGIAADKSNPRYLMSIGLILTGVFNLLFGATSTWIWFAIFWGLNGWFQGWGATCCAKLMTYWYSQSERGRWWSFWNTSHNLGGALIPLLAAGCAEAFGWRYAMFAPGIICIMIGVGMIFLMRDTPQSLGLPPIEKFRNDYPSKGFCDDKNDISVKQILWDYVLTNKFIWTLAIANLFIYVVRTGLNDWSMMYLKEIKGYSTLIAGSCVCWFEIGGFFGGLAAGWGSDMIFKGKRTPVNVIFTCGIIASILGFRMLSGYSPALDSLYLFLFGFFIFGPQMLIGLACAELAHKKAAATANGFSGCFGYLGAAMAGGPLGALTSAWGWESFFAAMIGCSVIAMACMLPLWSLKSAPTVAEERV